MNHAWQTISLLKEADDELITAFEENGWPVSYQEGEPILWEGDACEKVYFITTGVVEVYRSATDGREHTLRVLRDGDSFNIVPALLKDGTHRANVRCVQQTNLLVMDKNKLKQILVRFPSFALLVLQDLAERLAGMAELAGDLALTSVRQRTAAFLMRAAEQKQMDGEQRWTQDDMARQIGTVRDVIGRTLRDFEHKGLIRRDRGSIQLVDRIGLEKTVNGTE